MAYHIADSENKHIVKLAENSELLDAKFKEVLNQDDAPKGEAPEGEEHYLLQDYQYGVSGMSKSEYERVDEGKKILFKGTKAQILYTMKHIPIEGWMWPEK
jgi:hypothetical protein